MKVTVAFQFEDMGAPSLETCWANLELADKMRALELFAVSAAAWLRISGQNHQALERELRARSFDTHLIAATLPEGATVAVADSLPYYCIYSCRPRESALNELLQYAESYEQNFERLAQTADLRAIGASGLPPMATLAQSPMARLYSGQYRIHVVQ